MPYTQIFDDGSTLTYDDVSGLPISGVDSSGAPIYVPPPAGSPIVQQFANLFNYGVRAVYDLAIRKDQVQAAGAPRLQPSPLQRYVPVLLVAGAGVLIYSLLARK